MAKPFKSKIGKPLLSTSPQAMHGKPASPGKSASAPGQLKKAAGAQSAKTFTKGYKKR